MKMSEEKKKEILRKVHKWWYDARSIHELNRLEQANDDDFVDGIQWDTEERQILEARNQAPIVFNEIGPAIQWILGTEKRTKIDWKVSPRSDDDVKSAKTKTDLLKYISDVNKASFVRSKAFEEAVRAGIGWLEIGVSQAKDNEPLFIRKESWRNMWLDPLATEIDLSDARYIIRSKVLDVDTAKVLFPDKAEAFEYAAINRDAYGLSFGQQEDDYHDVASNQSDLATYNSFFSEKNDRRLVRLIECWYKEPSQVQIMRGIPKYEGMIFDPEDEGMKAAIDRVSLVKAIKHQIRMAIFIEDGELCQDVPSPYHHNKFPFVPIIAYQRARDNLPYGVTRNIKDPQRDLNKRRSKALYILSTNKTVMEEGAVADINDFEEEIAKPDAIIITRPGKKIDFNTDTGLAREHIMLAQQDADYVRQVAGVTGENLGLQTNATSGKAILARQTQGTVTTATLFDNFRLSVQLSGEIMLSLVEQFYTEEKSFRLTGEDGYTKFAKINAYDEETQQLNDITNFQSDYIVSIQDYRESMRLSMFEQMMDMLSKMDSQIALNFLDLVIEWSDLPGKDEMVKRIRKMNGQADPNDEEAQVEAEQQEAQKAAQAQQEAALTQQQIQVKLQEMQAKSQKSLADAQQTKVASMVDALNAAILLLQQPEAALMAQNIVKGADVARPGQQPEQPL